MDRDTVRRGHVTSATSRATVHNAAFPACQTPGFIGETGGSSVQYELKVVRNSVHKLVRNQNQSSVRSQLSK
jgi:hypothetical protein